MKQRIDFSVCGYLKCLFYEYAESRVVHVNCCGKPDEGPTHEDRCLSNGAYRSVCDGTVRWSGTAPSNCPYLLEQMAAEYKKEHANEVLS